MLTWPSPLPAPLFDGYDVSRIDVVERTTVDDGKFRSRPRAKKAPATVSLSVVLNAEQEDLFWAFHDYAIHQGTDAFLMRLRSGGQMRAMQVQFVSVPTQSQLGPNAVRVSMRVIVHSDFGNVLWADLVPGDFSYTTGGPHTAAAKVLGTLTDFNVTRVYVFGHVVFNGGTDQFALGWSANHEALVEYRATPSAGAMLSIPNIDSGGGTSLGNDVSGSKTIELRGQSDAVPTTGDACIVIAYTAAA